MPPLTPVPNALKVQLHWRVDANVLAMTNHYFGYGGGPPTESDVSSMANALVGFAQTAFAGMMPTTWGMDSAMVTDLSSATGAQATAGTPWLGTATGAGLAPASCTLVNHSISRKYRGGKPRSYLPIGTAADIASAGIWTSGHIAAALTAFNDWSTNFIGTSYGSTSIADLINISYYDGFTPVQNPMTHRWRNVPNRRIPPVVDAISSSSVQQIIGSQRRRNRDA